MDKSKVAILLLNINGYDVSKACIESIKKSDYDNYEIIFLDNGSVDGSGEKLKSNYPEIVYIRSEENTGFARGCNICAAKAIERGADFLWFLNNDTEVDSRALSELVSAASSRGDVGAAGSIIYYFGSDNVINFFKSKITWPHSFKSVRMPYSEKKDNGLLAIEESDYLHGCSMLVKRTAWEKTGPFDEQYFSYAEEMDWCIRAGRKGFCFLAVPSSKVWHKISFSTGGKASPLSSYYKTRNGLIMISKNYSSNIKFWSYVCFKYIKALSGVAVSMLLRKNLTRNLYILRGLNDFRRGVVGMFRSGSFRSDAREASKTN